MAVGHMLVAILVAALMGCMNFLFIGLADDSPEEGQGVPAHPQRSQQHRDPDQRLHLCQAQPPGVAQVYAAPSAQHLLRMLQNKGTLPVSRMLFSLHTNLCKDPEGN